MISRFPCPKWHVRGALGVAFFIGFWSYMVVMMSPNWYTIGWWNAWNVVILLIARVQERRLPDLRGLRPLDAGQDSAAGAASASWSAGSLVSSVRYEVLLADLVAHPDADQVVPRLEVHRDHDPPSTPSSHLVGPDVEELLAQDGAVAVGRLGGEEGPGSSSCGSPGWCGG